MSGLDGALIEEATAGMNAPADGDQNAVVRVNQEVAPELPNLRYQAVASFVTEMAPLFIREQDAASPEGSFLEELAIHTVDLPLTEGNVSEVEITAVTEDSAGDVEFYEKRRVIVRYPVGGPPTILNSAAIYTNPVTDWALTASISGTNLRASLENGTMTIRGCDVTLKFVRDRPIPALPDL